MSMSILILLLCSRVQTMEVQTIEPDLGEFERAFDQIKASNELIKTMKGALDRERLNSRRAKARDLINECRKTIKMIEDCVDEKSQAELKEIEKDLQRASESIEDKKPGLDMRTLSFGVGIGAVGAAWFLTRSMKK